LAKFYVVWRGRKTGIFTDWETCKAQVEAFSGARYKSFSTRHEAETAFGQVSNQKCPPKTSSTTLSKTTSRTKNYVKKVKASALTNDQIKAMPFDIKIFTDGACEPNPGEAGSGIAIYESNKLKSLWFGIYDAEGTNNTAELNALYQGLLKSQHYLNNNQSVCLFSDSNYSIQCLTTWANNWAKNGWEKKGGEIKNLNLIQTMFALYQTLENRIEIHHVNGHIGVEGNELADRMSIQAIEYKEKKLSLYQETMDIEQILNQRRG